MQIINENPTEVKSLDTGNQSIIAYATCWAQGYRWWTRPD